MTRCKSSRKLASGGAATNQLGNVYYVKMLPLRLPILPHDYKRCTPTSPATSPTCISSTLSCTSHAANVSPDCGVHCCIRMDLSTAVAAHVSSDLRQVQGSGLVMRRGGGKFSMQTTPVGNAYGGGTQVLCIVVHCGRRHAAYYDAS
jgi:hypothetical protein